MKYLQQIQEASHDPQRLEGLYQSALQEGFTAEFTADLFTCYQAAPEEVLYAAWYYRLENIPAERPAQPRRGSLWGLAVPFAFLTSLVLGLLAALLKDPFLDHIPYAILFLAPIAASFAILFLAAAAKKHYRRAILGIGLLVIASLYVLFIAPTMKAWLHNPYLDQMAIHLPLLAWIALGISLLWLRSLSKDRFAFLIKSIETAITAGLYLIAGMAFGAITIGMLQALSIEIPDTWVTFLIAGGLGLIPIIAIVSIYDPRLPPSEQDFEQGLSKFISRMMRLFLPLTLAVLVIYVLIIPFNALEPFKNRDVLIVYNIMLFAVMGLLLGSIPVLSGDLSPKMKSTLRYGILAVAGLAILVSLYALAAILYRTIIDSLTMNRLVILGWNVINIAILGFLAYRVARAGKEDWIEPAQSVFSLATNAYLVWTIFVIFAIPWLFR
jgi:hypothetical protein